MNIYYCKVSCITPGYWVYVFLHFCVPISVMLIRLNCTWPILLIFSENVLELLALECWYGYTSKNSYENLFTCNSPSSYCIKYENGIFNLSEHGVLARGFGRLCDVKYRCHRESCMREGDGSTACCCKGRKCNGNGRNIAVSSYVICGFLFAAVNHLISK